MKQKDTITTKWENIKKWENLTIQFTFNQWSPHLAAFTFDMKHQEVYYCLCECVFFRMTISLWFSIKSILPPKLLILKSKFPGDETFPD